MEQLTIISDNTPQGSEALQLHFEIKTSLLAAASAMVDFCQKLKQMRDTKLYMHIGFDNFESYVENAHGIRQRQAYTYIQTYEKLTPQLLQENSQIGITKLSLLCQVSAPEREEFAEQNDLANITVTEMQKLIEEKNGLSEQISLLQQEQKESTNILEEYNSKVQSLQQEIEKLSTQPIDVVAIESEKIDAAVQSALEIAEKEKQQAIEEVKEKVKQELAKKTEKETEKAIKQAEERVKKEFEEKNESLIKEIAAAKKVADNLEKQLSLAGNKETVKFSILFEQVQKDISACLETIEKIKSTDSTQAEKLQGALKTVLNSFD